MIVTISKCFVPKSWINYTEGYAILVWINSILESLLGGEDDDYVKRESAFDHIFMIDNHHATLTKTVNDIWWFKLCCEDGEDECHEDVYSFIHMPEEPTPSSADIEESVVMDTDDFNYSPDDFNYSPDDSFNWDLQDNEINWNRQDDDSIREAFDAATDLNDSDTEQTVIPLQFGGKPQSFILSGNREPWESSSSSSLSSSLSLS
ncbi:uncharacterized protein LOC123273945 [Cotesia glomerata]|uniref:uncharacterized protein LOC123273945 n=1 Tax=Cotesia glomerata TaxID=32391 RepID=UPI001D02F532|nr:uncharacterized protein LOC123273945 [Cotesia glomerata]